MTPPKSTQPSSRLPIREAADRIRDRVSPLGPVSVPTLEAAGRALAEPLTVRESLPRFDQSAMDGYAVRSADLDSASGQNPVSLPCRRTSPAGKESREPLPPGETVRIFTGGPVPEGADAVVAQEDVTRVDDQVEFSEPAAPGQHIRYEAEELESGERLLEGGTVLNTGGIGLALSQGYSELRVHRVPAASVYSLGDEIIDPERDPEPAQKRDTNGPMIAGRLTRYGCDPRQGRLPDDPSVLREQFEASLREDDLLVLVGGASVGDRDFVRPVLGELGVDTIFWKLNQKPGKPLYLGEGRGCYVLGLPGNPVSALVSFYLHGEALVRRLIGYPDDSLYPTRVTTRLTESYEKRSDRTEFVRARTRRTGSGFRSRVLSHQGSHMLSGVARANSLVILPDDRSEFGSGDRLECYLLPDAPLPDEEPFPRYE